MHDIYDGAALPPDRRPLQILRPSDRIGAPYLRCPLEKVSAVVLTNDPDYATPLRPADSDSQLIAGHLLDFLTHESRRGRLPATLLPLQSGVGNVTNAALAQLGSGPFRPLTAYTEVVQDGMLQLLRSGTMTMASATAFSLGEDGLAELHADVAAYRDKIILRPLEISNHPEVIRRARLPGDERHDRGRHLRQRQLQPHYGLEHAKRHRRIRRLRPPRLPGDVPVPVDGQERGDLVHRADGQPRRFTPSTTCTSSSPSRASPTCAACRRGAAPSRSSPPRAPRLPARAAGLPRPSSRHRTWQTHPPPAQRGVVMACALPAGRHHARLLSLPAGRDSDTAWDCVLP